MPLRLPRPGRAMLRLTLGVAAAIILLSLAAMLAQYRLTQRTLQARQVALVQADMEALAALYQQRRIPALREALAFRATAPAEAGTGLFLLLDKQGRPLAGNLPRWPPGLPPPRPGGFDTEGIAPLTLAGPPPQGGPFLGVTRLLPGGFALLVARSTAQDAATLAALRRLVAGVALVLVAVALGAGWLVSHRVLRRIARLNRLADLVAAGDLGARLPGPRSADEFGRLEAHVHHMLDRLQSLNRATNRLSDMIAHELRTPLNRIMQKLAALPDALSDALPAHGPALAAIEAEMRATIRIFDSLLDISAAEAQSGSRAGTLPVDLAALAAEVFELYAPAGEDRGLAMQAALTPGLWVLGDRNLIAQLIANLLDNAIKFTPAGGRVVLELRAEGGRQLLSVTDSGPGLPPDQAERVFERFARAKEADAVQGHGLGLALVKAIATRHGARLSLADAAPGLILRISWPAHPAPPAPAG